MGESVKVRGAAKERQIWKIAGDCLTAGQKYNGLYQGGLLIRRAREFVCKRKELLSEPTGETPILIYNDTNNGEYEKIATHESYLVVLRTGGLRLLCGQNLR